MNPLAYQLFHQDVQLALKDAHVDRALVDAELSQSCLWTISLPLATERRTLIESSILRPLQAIGVEAEFFNAVDGRKLPLDASMFRGGVQKFTFGDTEYVIDCSCWAGSAFGPFGAHIVEEFERRHASIFKYEGPDHRNSVCKNILNSITPGLVGGHLSHAGVWKEALARARQGSLDWVMILEDDAIPDPRLGLDWPAVWRITAHHIADLRRRKEQWDILYVGRYTSGTPEGRSLSRILVEPGWCCRTQTYCLSRQGLERLVNSGLVERLFDCPQDEVLGSLIINDHINPLMAKQIQAHCPPNWRALAFKHWGLTLQLMDVETTQRAESQVAPDD
jgi:hypothetical protein